MLPLSKIPILDKKLAKNKLKYPFSAKETGFDTPTVMVYSRTIDLGGTVSTQTIPDTQTLTDLDFDETLPEITLRDRCDACSQRAVSVTRVSDTLPLLYLCGHHWRKSSTAIKSQNLAYSVPDDEDVIFTFRFKEAEEAAAKNRD